MTFLISLLIILSGISTSFFINKGRICVSGAAAVLLVSALPDFSGVREAAVLLILADIAAFLADRWIVYTVSAFLHYICGYLLFFHGILSDRNTGPAWIQAPAVLLLLAETVLVFFTAVTAIVPSLVMKYIRDRLLHNGNITEAVSYTETLEHGITFVSDLQYDSERPNGYLDIYYPDQGSREKFFTVIYIHGGGYIWGDKLAGDPAGNGGGYDSSLVRYLVNEGYKVVSMNYALAPEYPFPHAVEQLNKGLGWLRENAGALKIDMDRVILAGASAGGNLAGILVNIHTNPVYSREIGIAPVLSGSAIKAVVFEGGLMDNRYFGITHNAVFDYVFFHMGRVYFRVNELKKNKKIIVSGVLEHISKNFPPSFISDGNTATFYDQAKELADRLSALGVPNELSIYPEKEAGKLIHGFEESGSVWGKKTMEKISVFLENIEKGDKK